MLSTLQAIETKVKNIQSEVAFLARREYDIPEETLAELGRLLIELEEVYK